MGSINLMFGAPLDLSRMDVGKVPLLPVEIRLAVLLDDAVTIFREQAARRGPLLR